MMQDIVKEYYVQPKNGKITINAERDDYIVYEYVDGTINIIPVERKKTTLIERLDKAVTNFKRRIVSPPIDLSYFK